MLAIICSRIVCLPFAIHRLKYKETEFFLFCMGVKPTLREEHRLRVFENKVEGDNWA
jgi:hypothetical protein